MTLYNPRVSRFVPVNMASFVVAGGAVGYVDTDVSATTGTNTRRLWFILINVVAAQDIGARPTGSALDVRGYCSITTSILSHVNAAGHMDLYRGAAQAEYRFIGYFEDVDQ